MVPRRREAESAAFAATNFTTEIEGGGDKPLLIIQGMEDIVAQPSIGHELREKFGTRVKVGDLDDAGHAMIIERTDIVADIIIQNPRNGGPRKEPGARMGARWCWSSALPPGTMFGESAVISAPAPKARRPIRKARRRPMTSRTLPPTSISAAVVEI